jgi:hypothetical protein
MVDQAIAALYDAGFEQENIRYSAPTPGGFFGDLKSIFTGGNTNVDNVTSDLSNMGLSDEEVQYYANEYNSGHTIVSINAPSREREALAIMSQYGAYNAGDNAGVKSNLLQDTTNPVQETLPSDQSYAVYDQQYIITSDNELDDQSTQPVVSAYSSESYDESAAAALAENDANNQVVPASTNNVEYTAEDATTQPMASEDDDPQNQVMVSEDETDHQTSQPDSIASGHEATGYQETQPEVLTSADDATPSNEVAVENETNTQDPAIASDATAGQTVDTPKAETADQIDQLPEQNVANNQASNSPDNETTYQEPQANTFTPEQEASNQTSQPNLIAPQYTNKLQMLQQQLQTTQQRLQEAKAQLQAAKEHETQLQQTQQQLQALQTEVEATQAELQETQSRIEQY